MTEQILFIHGGTGEEAFNADQKLVSSLRKSLGNEYDVVYPRMPDDPTCEVWKAEIAKGIASLDDGLMLAGHSFGGSLILKYLSETQVDKSIKGVFLMAMPYWGAVDWEVDVYELASDFASHLPEGVPIYLYHSRDDEIVSFSHLAMYTEKISWAKVREFDEGGHQFNDDLSVVAADIASL